MTRKPAAQPAPAATPEANADAAPAPTPQPTPAAPKLCNCGCGETTKRPTASYVAGHDARHAGEIGRQAHANGDRELIGLVFKDAPKLAAKAQNVVDTATRKAAEKLANAQLRAELAAKLAEVKAAHAAK
jgi:hypothetical protein